MIIAAWPAGFREKFGGVFPPNYLCIDTEFTGRNERDDLVLEIAHVLVVDGTVQDQCCFVLNWYEHMQIQPQWLDYKLAQMRKVVGASWRLSSDVVRNGASPLEVLRFYSDLLQTWQARQFPFVAQNGINADEPMLRANFRRFLQRDFSFPADAYFDTGAIYKADCLWRATSGNFANYSKIVIPQDYENLRGYCKRICALNVPALRWSLGAIVEQLGLAKKHALNLAEKHAASFDAKCLYLIMEEYRRLTQLAEAAARGKAVNSVSAPVEFATRNAASVSQRMYRRQRKA